MTTTMVECPREKKYPMLSGRGDPGTPWRSFISFRVVLSMAEMWSASKAWRDPSV